MYFLRLTQWHKRGSRGVKRDTGIHRSTILALRKRAIVINTTIQILEPVTLQKIICVVTGTRKAVLVTPKMGITNVQRDTGTQISTILALKRKIVVSSITAQTMGRVTLQRIICAVIGISKAALATENKTSQEIIDESKRAPVGAFLHLGWDIK